MVSDYIEALRSATSKQHTALHTHPVLGPLSSASITHSEYIAALTSLYGFHSGLADAMKTADMPLQDLFFRYAAPTWEWQEADLNGYDIHYSELPVCRELPPAESPAQVLGILYVKEGSLLGGRQLCRNLINVLGEEGHFFRYFSGKGAQTGEHWQQLMSAINQLPASETEILTTSARQTFRALTEWLDNCHHTATAGTV